MKGLNLFSYALNLVLLIVIALMIMLPKTVSYGVSLSQYNEIEQGMSYVDVCYIFKQDGVVLCDLNNDTVMQTSVSSDDYKVIKLSALNGIGGIGGSGTTTGTEIVQPDEKNEVVEDSADSIADIFNNADNQVDKTVEDTANDIADLFANLGTLEKDLVPNVKIVKWQGKASKDSYCLITFVDDKVEVKVQEGLK